MVSNMNKPDYKAPPCLLLCLAFLFSLSGCREPGYLSKREIFDLVNENKNTLLECIEKEEYSALSAISPLIEESVLAEGIVDFSCGGKGLSVSGIDYGFYYSPENAPTTCHNYENLGLHGTLTPKEKGFEGKNYYTEQICDHFFYYESYF